MPKKLLIITMVLSIQIKIFLTEFNLVSIAFPLANAMAAHESKRSKLLQISSK